MNAQSTAGVGLIVNCRDFKNIVVSIGSTGSANATVKCLGAIALNDTSNPPDFSATPTVSNAWDHLQMINLQDGTTVNGSTGVVFSGTDFIQQYSVNSSILDYVTFRITARSAGAITINMLLTNNV